MNEKLNSRIDDIIRLALEEDIRSGDITTEAIVDHKLSAKADFLVKQDGIIAGIEVVRTVFHNVDPELIFINTVKDGERVFKGKFIGTVEGKAASILSAERTALNFLQRMSGIATYANQFAEKIKHTKAKIIDTRKTVPGLRLLDKMAVRIGGCENHRMGLYDLFLIKDNHIEVAGSITKAIEACREYSKRKNVKFKIEVETKNPAEVKEALNSQPDIIMLDNFTIEQMKEAVNLINGKCKIEASGGINIDTVKDIAETGVDYISVGAITHSVKALDISLEIITE